MDDLFANYDSAEIWYHPLADRLFIYHQATFLQLPRLEREDGAVCFCRHPYDVNADVQEHLGKLEYIGKL